MIHLSYKPEKIFLFFSITFGILFLLCTPPFQSADEVVHFFKAYQVSMGTFIPEKESTIVGGMLPQSLDTTASRFLYIGIKPQNKFQIQSSLELLDLPLEENKKVFLKTTPYFPLPYLPQSLGILCGRLEGFSPLFLMYLGRLFNLSAWILLIYYSIQKMPIFRWLMLLLALSPMSLFEASSLSPDAWTNGFSFLLIATYFQIALDPKKVFSKQDLILLLLLGLSVGVSKQIYFFLSFLFLMIPLHKIGSKKRYWGYFLLVALPSIAAGSLWSLFIVHLGWDQMVNPGGQLKFLIHEPLKYFSVVVHTFHVRGAFYIESFMGRLGWLETVIPSATLWFYGLFLILLIGFDSSVEQSLKWKQRVVCAGTFLIGVCLLATSFYLLATPVGFGKILGIQGRYFIPFGLLLFLPFHHRNNLLGKYQVSITRLGTTCVLLIVLMVSLRTIILRYYFYP